MIKLTEYTLRLIDAKQRWLGEIGIEQIADNLIFGRFVPGPDFPAVVDIFERFEEAVSAQALSVVDELDVEIAALGLRLCLPNKTEWFNIHDVQIWRDGNITCRLANVGVMPGDSLQKASANGQPVEMVHLQLH